MPLTMCCVVNGVQNSRSLMVLKVVKGQGSVFDIKMQSKQNVSHNVNSIAIHALCVTSPK